MSVRDSFDLPDDAGDGLATTRLFLRRFTPADLIWLTALNADAEVTRHIGGTKNSDQSREMLETRILRYYDDHPGLGVWLTCRRDDDEPVGFHLLNHIQGESLVQVGYTLLKAYWGYGYATEMSCALLHYGAVRRGLKTLLAIANLDNAASHRVLLKSGLERRGQRFFPHPAYAASGDLAYFERDAADWLAERAPHGVLE